MGKPNRSRPRQPEIGERFHVSSYVNGTYNRRLELVSSKENRSKASVVATAIKEYLDRALGLTKE